MIEAFFGDALCTAMQTGATCSAALRELSTTLLTTVNLPSTQTEICKLPEPCQAALTRIAKVSACLASLLTPRDDFTGASVKDVHYFRTYSGELAMETMMRTMMSDGYYGKLADEQLRTAGSSKTMVPLLQEIENGMANPSEDIVHKAVTNLPAFRTNLRAGSIDGLESTLKVYLLDTVKIICALPVTSPNVSPSWIDTLTKGLDLFVKTGANVLEAVKKLDAWTVQASKALSFTEMYEAASQIANATEPGDIDIGRLSSAFLKCQDVAAAALNPDTTAALTKSTLVMMQALKLKATQLTLHLLELCSCFLNYCDSVNNVLTVDLSQARLLLWVIPRRSQKVSSVRCNLLCGTAS